jgi:hypothetical protein
MTLILLNFIHWELSFFFDKILSKVKKWKINKVVESEEEQQREYNISRKQKEILDNIYMEELKADPHSLLTFGTQQSSWSGRKSKHWKKH